MAKLRNLPRKPKQTASLDTWKNWERRCREVQAYNRQIAKDKKAKQAIISRASGMKKI